MSYGPPGVGPYRSVLARAASYLFPHLNTFTMMYREKSPTYFGMIAMLVKFKSTIQKLVCTLETETGKKKTP